MRDDEREKTIVNQWARRDRGEARRDERAMKKRELSQTNNQKTTDKLVIFLFIYGSSLDVCVWLTENKWANVTHWFSYGNKKIGCKSIWFVVVGVFVHLVVAIAFDAVRLKSTRHGRHSLFIQPSARTLHKMRTRTHYWRHFDLRISKSDFILLCNKIIF